MINYKTSVYTLLRAIGNLSATASILHIIGKILLRGYLPFITDLNIIQDLQPKFNNKNSLQD